MEVHYLTTTARKQIKIPSGFTGTTSKMNWDVNKIYFGWILLQNLMLRSLCVYALKQLFFSMLGNSGRIFWRHSPRVQRIIITLLILLHLPPKSEQLDWDLSPKKPTPFPPKSDCLGRVSGLSGGFHLGYSDASGDDFSVLSCSKILER